ncbi:MAG: uroporphyrinogen-III decarboxylase [Actinobacteria bacterium]|nr:uroporphyrinogen-III decarboxylase [Actinomycetota bacterium]
MVKRELTPRERVLIALAHKEPDRVPIDFGGQLTGITIVAYKNLIDYLKVEEPVETLEEIWQHAVVSETVLCRFGVDTRWVRPEGPSRWRLEHYELAEGSRELIAFKDEFGIEWAMPKVGGHWYDLRTPPLRDATLADLEHYPWPDARDPARWANLRARAEHLQRATEYAICGDAAGIILDFCSWLRGMEQLFVDLLLNRLFVERLLDIITQWWLDYLDCYLREVGDIISILALADDLGCQQGPLINPQIWRQLVKPRLQELCQFIHNHSSALVFFHSCGSVVDFIPDLIEVGVDILNPVQVTARGMDTKQLKAEFGNALTFWGGGCDSQWVLPFGSTKDVRREVCHRVADLAPGGGFVFNPVQNIQAEVPPENIVTMFDTARVCGQYGSSLRGSSGNSR